MLHRLEQRNAAISRFRHEARPQPVGGEGGLIEPGLTGAAFRIRLTDRGVRGPSILPHRSILRNTDPAEIFASANHVL